MKRALLLLVLPVLFAQTTAPAPTSDLKLSLMDGSLISGTLSVSDLSVDTDFGPLKIPMNRIQSFTPGLDNHVELEKKIDDLITDLAADSFGAREKAQQTLAKMGPEIRPELQAALKTAESEKQTRLQKILEDFDAQAEDSDEPPATSGWKHADTIVTDTFTISGHITTPTFTINNPYGTLTLKLSDIRQARREAAEPEDLHKSMSVTGAVITQHSYEPANIKVSRGDQIQITATGAITMTPWGNIQATPDGGGNFGIIQPGNIPGGALIARIGTGAPFKVGSKLTITADKSGPLSFSVAMPGNYAGNDFPGQYDLKIHIVKKP